MLSFTSGEEHPEPLIIGDGEFQLPGFALASTKAIRSLALVRRSVTLGDRGGRSA